MNTKNKKILLSVTGMSPAVVTETLYALVTEKGFIPDEIQVITTLQGKEKLLNILCGENGALDSFINDYGSKYGVEKIHFDESCIHIIKDKENQDLADIRTPEENNLAADQIVELVGKLCSDANNQLHISIAGGRKTMGFFIGYALSLYGREQDSLSHVLVSEGYENQPKFYYPTPKSKLLANGLDAQNAKVMLAEIPWVRLGLGMPEHLKNQKISYSQSVEKAQELLKTPKISFLHPIDHREVMFGEKTKIKLSHRGYAFLLTLVIMKKKGWEFSLDNEETVKSIYMDIYDILSIAKELPSAEKIEHDSKKFKDLIRDSRTNVVKNIQEAFYIGKGVETAYTPLADRKEELRYDLSIDVANLNIEKIKNDISHLL